MGKEDSSTESSRSRATTVDDIVVVNREGPWHSKSGGRLEVFLALPRGTLEKFLDYSNPAFDAIPEDIRGLRTYTVSDVPKGSVGAKEWHKARTEFLTVTRGSVILDCVDMNGNEREFTLNGTAGVIVPPNIFHTYQSLEDHTNIQVIANTLFVPDNPLTHDTFFIDTFEK